MGLTCSHLGTHLLDQTPGNEQWCTSCGSLREPSLRDSTPTSWQTMTPSTGWGQLLRQGWADLLCLSNQAHKPRGSTQQWSVLEGKCYNTGSGVYPAPDTPTSSIIPLMRTGRKQATDLPHHLSLRHLKHCPKILCSCQCLQVTSLIN